MPEPHLEAAGYAIVMPRLPCSHLHRTWKEEIAMILECVALSGQCRDAAAAEVGAGILLVWMYSRASICS